MGSVFIPQRRRSHRPDGFGPILAGEKKYQSFDKFGKFGISANAEVFRRLLRKNLSEKAMSAMLTVHTSILGWHRTGSEKKRSSNKKVLDCQSQPILEKEENLII